MSKNEVDIRFKAETQEFRNSIKEANSAMSALRSETAKNEAEFKSTGDSIAYLESKQDICFGAVAF